MAARARSTRAESTQDLGSPGSSAVAPPLPEGPRRRSRGAATPRATQAGIPNRRPRLLLDPARLTCRSAPRRHRGYRLHLRCLANRSPPLAPQYTGPGSAPGRAGLREPRLRGRGVFPPLGEDTGGAGAASWNRAPAAAVVPATARSRRPAVCARARGGAAGAWAP